MKRRPVTPPRRPLHIQMRLDQQGHIRELERWKAQARRSPDGRMDIGGGWSIQYTPPQEPAR